MDAAEKPACHTEMWDLFSVTERCQFVPLMFSVWRRQLGSAQGWETVNERDAGPLTTHIKCVSVCVLNSERGVHIAALCVF